MGNNCVTELPAELPTKVFVQTNRRKVLWHQVNEPIVKVTPQNTCPHPLRYIINYTKIASTVRALVGTRHVLAGAQMRFEKFNFPIKMSTELWPILSEMDSNSSVPRTVRRIPWLRKRNIARVFVHLQKLKYWKNRRSELWDTVR